jgi:HD superfamily phosphohydrolase
MHSGVAYGIYDLNWLIATLTVGIARENELVVGFDRRKAPRVVEQFLIARRALYDMVYHHKTVRSAEGMLGHLLKRLKEVVKADGWPLSDTPHFRPFRKAIEGGPLQIEEILILDDYSLWVMIQGLSEIGDRDPTLSDLAFRLISRDLFKLVPCDSDRLNSFLSDHDNHKRLQEAVSPFCSGVGRYYYFTDDASFDMLASAPDERAYFVDLDRSERPASYIDEHPDLASYRSQRRTVRRLFCIREAVDTIAKLIV